MSIQTKVGSNGEEIVAAAPTDDGPSIAISDEAVERKVLEKIQARTHEIAEYVRKQMLEDAKSKVNENPLVTLLMALGLGFVLGFILRGLGRRD